MTNASDSKGKKSWPGAADVFQEIKSGRLPPSADLSQRNVAEAPGGGLESMVLAATIKPASLDGLEAGPTVKEALISALPGTHCTSHSSQSTLALSSTGP